MANLKLSYNSTLHKARVQYANDPGLAGYTTLGTFTHDLSKGEYGPNSLKTLYEVARELLESAEGIVNMQFIEINLDEIINVSSITIAPATVSKVIGQTQQLTITWSPTDATDKTIASWVSSDPAKATVNSSGLVTAVAAGTTIITATTTDGAKTATRTITVTSS